MRLSLITIAVLIAVAVLAADWPRFQGPEGTGISPETGLARAWPAGGPKVRWTAPVSEGYSGPAVRDGMVYFMDRDETRGAAKDILRVLDLGTGVEAWRVEMPTWRTLGSYPGGRTTPLVDEEYVHTTGVIGHITCIRKATHEIVWQHYIGQEYKNSSPSWGVTWSPVRYKDSIIVPVLSDRVGLVAFDRLTGKMLWESKTIGRQFYTHMTPYVTTLCGVDQVVMIANVYMGPEANMAGVDAATGKVLWKFKLWRNYNIPIAQPLTIADDTLLVAGGYRIGLFTVKLTRNGDAWTWAYGIKDNRNCTPQLQRSILYDGYLYAQSTDRLHNTPDRDERDDGRVLTNRGLTCLTLDGQIKWETGPDDDMNQGGILVADGLLYAMDGSTGELRLVEARPDRYVELARAKVLSAKKGKEGNGDGFWAPLALSDGKLLCRDGEKLVCLDVRNR